MPTQDQLNNREQAIANLTAGRPQDFNINSGTLAEGTGDFAIPQPDTPTDLPSVIGSIPSIEQLLTQFNTPTEAENTQSALQSRIVEALGELGGRSEVQAQEEADRGIPENLRRLRELSGRLTQLQNESLAIPLQIQQESQGRGRTAAGVRPIETARLRRNAIQSLSVGAQAQALAGNISLAQQQANRAVDLEFEPLETELQQLQQLYVFNRDELQRIDKKRADELQVRLQERSRVLSDLKEESKLKQNVLLEAARNNASPETLERIREAGTPDEAIALASNALGAGFRQEMEQRAFENGLKLRSMRLQEAEFALNRRKSLLELAAGGDAQAIQELGYDPNNIPLTSEEILENEEQYAALQGDLNRLTGMLDNNLGLESVSGNIRSPILSATFNPLGGPFRIPATISKKNDFLADASYVLNNLTFERLGEITENTTLGAISEGELRAVGAAANELAGAARYDDSGNLTGFAMSEDKVREQLKKIQDNIQEAQLKLNREVGLTSDELDEITGIRL